jgi:deoxyribodipyrimidine photo-lyase
MIYLIDKLVEELKDCNTPIVIHWFRRDLRLVDNTALKKALASGYKVLPLFIFDDEILKNLDKDDIRISFIYQSLEHLNLELVHFNSGIRVLAGSPVEIFKKLTSQLPIKLIYANSDYEPYAIERDEKVRVSTHHNGAEFLGFKDQVIFEKDEIVKADSKPYTVFTPYSKKWNLNYISSHGIQSSPDYLQTPSFINLTRKSIISLSELGFLEKKGVFSLPVVNEDIILQYDKTRNFPSINGTSHLGTHLRFGTISIRMLVEKAFRLNKTWLNELQWREFFMQILWHFPEVITKPFKSQYDRIQWINNESEFERWCNGETGYPFVDAGMRELKTTGFMHNRVRMITASFLVKHLLIDWRWGENWFAHKLLDYELSSNNGNWQWAAGCGCDAAPYFRIFNPQAQAEKFDTNNLYIRKWVPEFEKSTYPSPIIEHSYARNRCLQAYSAVR